MPNGARSFPLNHTMPKYSVNTLLFCLAICSCKKEEMPAFSAPIEANNADASGQDQSTQSDAVRWRALPDWKMEEAGEFLSAAYLVPEIGRLTVSKLGGDGGGLAANVNRWRGQVNMRALPKDQVQGKPIKITDSSREILFFNLNPNDAPTEAEGILAAVLSLDSETWFFKLTGSSTKLHEKGDELFMSFLSNVRIVKMQEAASAPAQSPKIQVIAPQDWKVSQGSSMRVASFAVKGEGGTTADVSVIPLPGNSGSVLDNVNRWRGQVQLPPLATADDPALGVEMIGTAGKLIVTHIVSVEPLLDGKKSAILGAILEAKGVTWFFKMTGEASLVEANREKFEMFARTAFFQ